MSLMKMENLFQRANLSYQSMELNTPYDVSNLNMKIKSYNHSTSKIEYNKVLNLVRKDDSPVFHLVSEDGSILLKCTENHRIFNKDSNDYVYVGSIKNGIAINEIGQEIKFNVVKTSDISPILDLEVENTNNYFSNGLLSHNTTPGGAATKFFASIRLEVRKIETSGGSDTEDAYGIKSRVKCIKNKTGIPFRKGEMDFNFKTGVDFYKEYLDFAVSLGYIKKGGAWYTTENDEKFCGSSKVIEAFKSNPDFFNEIKTKVDNVLNSEPEKRIELIEEDVSVDDGMTEEQAKAFIEKQNSEG